MMRHIYALPLHMVIILMLALLIVWAMLSLHKNQKKRTIINLVLCSITALTILYATILTRTPGDYKPILTPFATFTAALQQPELYREMLMNIFLFFPLGLTLSNALPRKWHRWGRIALTTLVGCALSAGIEYTQYRYALGMAEVDDVICNTLGAFLGSTSLLIAHAIEKHKERAWHTNMTLTATERQFLHIAKAAVSGGALPAENVDWPAVFCVGHLVRCGQLVHRRVGGQTVCKKLLVAGHELRIGNVQVIVRADAVVLQRIQAAAKLPLDHNGMQSRRTQLMIKVGKLRRTHGLVPTPAQ